MSSPWEVAKAVGESDFGKLLSCAGEYGLLFCDKKCFIAAIPALSSDLRAGRTRNTGISLDKCDTWFVLLASGDPMAMFCTAKEMKFVAYWRIRGGMRIVEYSRLKELLRHGK